MKRDFLSLLDISTEECEHLLDLAAKIKSDWTAGQLTPVLPQRTLGLIFSKPSTRTRVSFEVAMHRLGGHCTFMSVQDTQIARAEPLSDTARVLSRYIDALVVRTYAQQELETLARYASIPVINGLTDLYHPCQVLSDLLTIREKRGSLDDMVVAWIGDGNNMAHSWINASARLGFRLNVACPEGYWPSAKVIERARTEGAARICLFDDPREAVKDTDVINTDVWASMGQESEAAVRRSIFQPYQVNQELLKAAPSHAMVLHCLPAHRGEEITEQVLEGPQSVVFDQAENRLHAQAALIYWLLVEAAG
ncbi:ornithine carbamoyltransferase [Desulfacinum hydrothermale DSM 13146]|uniref:Ornithine carbamoyltransferase n=1 Tax=Desulfacinum hydrothermale DSM 13146 TaxID=1121390 RepID=A0A1W1X818_9BACT|nr:ornithine carbamoyltransferase [Desulfacinum hydrothermale]SMC20125.1 ornithine carbamoyltransferase [Desulfacinum hydrothermale DSM 13146]